MALKINPEFFAYLPRHSEEDHARLEEQLIAEGVLDPLRVWKGHDIIVDGMERHGIAEKHGLKYEVEYLEFEDREAVLVWMSKNQIARRNTTKEQHDYHLGVYYNSKKKELIGNFFRAGHAYHLGNYDPHIVPDAYSTKGLKK